jgi:hypothetical protein
MTNTRLTEEDVLAWLGGIDHESTDKLVDTLCLICNGEYPPEEFAKDAKDCNDGEG